MREELCRRSGRRGGRRHRRDCGFRPVGHRQFPDGGDAGRGRHRRLRRLSGSAGHKRRHQRVPHCHGGGHHRYVRHVGRAGHPQRRHGRQPHRPRGDGHSGAGGRGCAGLPELRAVPQHRERRVQRHPGGLRGPLSRSSPRPPPRRSRHWATWRATPSGICRTL